MKERNSNFDFNANKKYLVSTGTYRTEMPFSKLAVYKRADGKVEVETNVYTSDAIYPEMNFQHQLDMLNNILEGMGKERIECQYIVQTTYSLTDGDNGKRFMIITMYESVLFKNKSMEHLNEIWALGETEAFCIINSMLNILGNKA